MLLDIGVGIFMALLVGKMFAMPIGLFLIASGIIFSLLMDADAFVNLIRNRGVAQSYKHRDLFHLPLLYIPIGMIALYFCTHTPAFAVLFGLTSLAHFIHDSIGLGWGVKWLYPFNSNQYSFFYQYNAHRAELRPNRYGIYIWKTGEIDSIEEKYGDKDWFRQIYLKPHPYSLSETGVFLIALAVLYFFTISF